MPGAPVFWRLSAEALIQIIPVAKSGPGNTPPDQRLLGGQKAFLDQPDIIFRTNG